MMSEDVLLKVTELSVEYKAHAGGLFWGRQTVSAVAGASFELAAGETLGVVGESGCGKSTLARAVLGLTPSTSGAVEFLGRDLRKMRKAELRAERQRMQMIFQDSSASLDPSMTIKQILVEPLAVHGWGTTAQRRDRVVELLSLVELGGHLVERYPMEISGGQRQRVAIARAIAMNPRLIIADESLSALDVSTQGQICNLLLSLQQTLGVSFVFVSHDLTLVQIISDRIVVMYLGKIVEEGPADRVGNRPAHPYTLALRSAVFVPDPAVQRQRQRIVLSDELPSPLDPPSGCRFRTRCPWAMPVCSAEEPKRTPIEGGGWAACHLYQQGKLRPGEPLENLEMNKA